MNRVCLYSLTLAVCAAMVISKSHAQETVTIGTQLWMTKNLNVDKFRNGDPIPEAKTDEEWKTAGENKQPAWCYNDNDPANGAKYGKLYNWYAVNDARGLAPAGYHVPSDAEWTILENQLGSDLGTKMKSTVGWDNSGNGTNSSGFNGEAGGCRNFNGFFGIIGLNGLWWTSSEENMADAWRRLLLCDQSDVFIGYYDKKNGYSVRCLGD